MNEKLHFHIYWCEKDRLDWESFDTEEQALKRAEELSRPGEMFRVELLPETCPVCGPKAASAN